MSDRPNVLLILTDHFRGDCIGRLGHPVAETPHLDSLSRDGAIFSRGYTPCPSCVPARRSLMTGMTPYSAGMVGYQDGKPWQYKHTMAGEMTAAGYQSINIGKTHFHPKRLHLGFEQLITPEDYEEWLSSQPSIDVERLGHGVHANSWMARPNHLPEHLMEETWFTSRARDFLEKRDTTRPFFMCLSFNGPHPPWCPPTTYYDQFVNRDLPAPTVGEWAQHHQEDAEYPLDVNAWRGSIENHLHHRARAAYFAYLSYIDAQVGRLMNILTRGGNKNTLVLFTSDHGEMLGDHNLWRKTYAYEASARVPFIIKLPSSMKGPRNRKITNLVGWEDIMPTFLDIAGASIPSQVEGKSLLPLLLGGNSPSREYYHGEHSPCYHPENANQFLTDQTWKYIWNPITGKEQLFDISNDPEECRDLSNVEKYSMTTEDWRLRLAKHLKGRIEGLSDGKTLKPSKVTAWVGGKSDSFHKG